MTKSVSLKRGFTLLEILLVVGIIAILAGIVILAINPTKQLGDTRNAQRRSDVLTILNAVYQYSIDNNGDVTGLTIATSSDCNAVSGTDASSLWGELVTASSTYLTAIPHDPSVPDPGQDVSSGSGYYVIQLPSGRITVCTDEATQENGAVISVTR